MASFQSVSVLSLIAGTIGITLPTLDIQVRDYPQAVGLFDKGTLITADEFHESTETTVKLFPTRARRYGTQDLTTLLESSARGMRILFPKSERLQIGDISQKQGGYIDGHGSHQIGVDVDLAYFRTDGKELDPKIVTSFPINYVVGGKLDPVFDLEKNLRFLQLLESSKRMNRVFVDPVIKIKLCEYVDQIGEKKELTETLRMLRPYVNHQDHFHVRITCPAASTKCIPQAAKVPPGDGCAEAGKFAKALYKQGSALNSTELQTFLSEEDPGC